MELDDRFRRPRYTLRKPRLRSELRIYDHHELVFRFQAHQLYGTDACTKLLDIDGPVIVHYLGSYVVRDHVNDETLETIQNRDEPTFTNDHWTVFDPQGSIIGRAIASESGLLPHLLPLTSTTCVITAHQSRVATLHRPPGSREWDLTIREASPETANSTLDRRLVIALASLLASIVGMGGGAGGGAGGAVETHGSGYWAFPVTGAPTAVHMLDGRADIVDVKDWLGHRSMQNTMIDAQLTDKARDEQARRVFASPKIVGSK